MTEIYVKVRPDSEEFRIEMKDFPIIYLESKAESGRANTELVKRLEEVLGEKPGIISGHRSKRKKITVKMSKERFKKELSDFNG